LIDLAETQSVDAPLLPAILGSNDAHERWLRGRVQALLGDSGERPVAAVLGLSYKPAAGTRARSSAAALCAWLRERDVGVRAHDPASGAEPGLPAGVTLCDSARGALRGADLAVVATEWPEYRALAADDFVSAMRRPRVVDAGGFLAGLASDPRVLYLSPGRRPAGQV
jgi:UDPglucose 6-dehydrogenase